MLRVALTGGIATGKSYVRARFAAREVPTIDADRVARKVVEPDRPAWHALKARFGAGMFSPGGTLDRKKLAGVAFQDPAARTDLEAIVHPHVRAAIDEWFQSLSDRGATRFAIADIPLLFETNRAGEFDRVVVTTCERATQLTRLMTRDGLSEKQGRQRLDAQLPSSVKVAGADFVIRTDGTFDDTDAQVNDAYERLTRETG